MGALLTYEVTALFRQTAKLDMAECLTTDELGSFGDRMYSQLS